MPRYFQSSVTGRPLVIKTPTGDWSFIFELVEPMGGSWLGALVVDDESAASVLASSEGAWEITADKYDELKKKRAGAVTPQGFVPWQTPQLPPQPLVAAGPAGVPSASVSKPEVTGGTGGAKVLASVQLLTTDKKPPAEPLLEAGTPKRRKAA